MSAAASAIPYFLRAWQLTLNTQSGQTISLSNQQGDLRVTFAVETYMLMAYWTAVVSIYNIGQQTGNQVQGSPNITDFIQSGQALKMGDSITLSAGYQNTAGPGSTGAFSPAANQIYKGTVLQSWWTRENDVDLVLHLRCVLGLFQDAFGKVSLSLQAGGTDQATINQICSPQQANIPVNIDDGAKQLLGQTTHSRGKVINDRPYDAIRTLTDKYKGQVYTWLDQTGTLQVRTFNPANISTPPFAYAPAPVVGGVSLNVLPQSSGAQPQALKYTLIGSPQQTQDGILFKVLLDSSVVIGGTVQLAPGVLVNAFAIQLGKSLAPVTNPTGIYVVAGARHVGDTRGTGDDWFTEIQGVTPRFFQDFLQQKQPN